MNRNVNLLEGKIFPALTSLALPIMLTALVQMAYSLTDMIWIGRLSAGAVAAVGASSMFGWLSRGMGIVASMGGQVLVAQKLGAGDQKEAVSFARLAIQMGVFFSVLFGFFTVFFNRPLIGFFRLNAASVVADARIYLIITCGLVIFSVLNQILTGLLTAMGNSRTPFLVNAAGMTLNILLDPLLIFGAGPVPAMGVSGAAVATVGSQAFVFLLFVLSIRREPVIFSKISLLRKPDSHRIRVLVRIGLPSALQNMAFSAISMYIARMIAGWGDAAVAVQKVGSQIESISWMTADGFSAAVNAFVAQNFGSGNRSRIRQGYRISMAVVTVWGIFCTLVLFLLPGPIFQFFIPDATVLPMGIQYLKILSLSQLFMCVEITTAGAFSGLGKTLPPSLVGILFTSARIPAATVLMSTSLGLNGIWWSITVSSILKGVLLFLWFLLFERSFFGSERQKRTLRSCR
ncbi:MAG: MATE family efflux transporter [Lachnospiraceae bacterium]|nr:MATE family efflux transporter [Lachnospiraceae bacterium]